MFSLNILVRFLWYALFFCCINNFYCLFVLFLFADIWPSVSTGIVSHVVRVPEPLHIEKSGIVETEKRSVPVMLQTTAAVHPGASGGAVVDSNGHMIGLITRYFVFSATLRLLCTRNMTWKSECKNILMFCWTDECSNCIFMKSCYPQLCICHIYLLCYHSSSENLFYYYSKHEFNKGMEEI